MKIEILERAIFFYYNGSVVLTHEDKDYIWFMVDDIPVKFSYGEGYLKITCSCTHCSNKSYSEKDLIEEGQNIRKVTERNVLCSRKLACLFFLEHRQLSEQRKKRKKK